MIGSTTVFGSDTPVGGVVVDQQAALLAEACLQPGMAKCTLGTGAFLLANTGTAGVRSTAGLTSSVAWRIAWADTFCVDGQVYTAASAVRWLEFTGPDRRCGADRRGGRRGQLRGVLRAGSPPAWPPRGGSRRPPPPWPG